MSRLVFAALASPDGESEAIIDFARIWRAADKVVYSTSLPPDLRLDLELSATRRFGNGVVYLGYRLLG